MLKALIRKLRFGVPSANLTFSKDVTITFDVGTEYNGQSLNIFSRSDGGDDGWEPMGIDCSVVAGNCSFETDHASYFAITEYTSIAETEEGESDDEDDDSEKADIDSWKAYRYEDQNSKLCKDKLKLEIKGKHFDKDAKVKIGSKEAYSVERESSKKIVAKFCMNKLLENKTSRKKTISVINPDADTEKADKKIHLEDIDYNMLVGDFNLQTVEGVKNIQKALAQLGFLDKQYITGIYGSITTEAVKKFQEQNSLPTTGYVGMLTKAKLAEKIK
ncbi:MAG: peptidoglycan-binding domain-containing protein [Candidatus Moranbacteria bacterium]|nr:peptidoglycan-binding domain-containing protein [Candidatus Moranbacteria bacterium]